MNVTERQIPVVQIFVFRSIAKEYQTYPRIGVLDQQRTSQSRVSRLSRYLALCHLETVVHHQYQLDLLHRRRSELVDAASQGSPGILLV